VISNVDDGLLISLAVTCDQQRSAVGLVISVGYNPARRITWSFRRRRSQPISLDWRKTPSN